MKNGGGLGKAGRQRRLGVYTQQQAVSKAAAACAALATPYDAISRALLGPAHADMRTKHDYHACRHAVTGRLRHALI